MQGYTGINIQGQGWVMARAGYGKGQGQDQGQARGGARIAARGGARIAAMVRAGVKGTAKARVKTMARAGQTWGQVQGLARASNRGNPSGIQITRLYMGKDTNTDTILHLTPAKCNHLLIITMSYNVKQDTYCTIFLACILFISCPLKQSRHK